MTVPPRIIRLAALALCVFGAVQAYVRDEAAAAERSVGVWFFQGLCEDSYLWKGAPMEDMTNSPGDAISCKRAFLMEVPNGRNLMSFVTGASGTRFAGGALDPKTNPKLLIMPIDRIHPARDLGTIPSEIYRRAASGEGALDGAEGFCFFSSHKLAATEELSCVAKHTSGNNKTVYRIKMEIKKVDKRTHRPFHYPTTIVF
jgi:hypothetical protein